MQYNLGLILLGKSSLSVLNMASQLQLVSCFDPAAQIRMIIQKLCPVSSCELKYCSLPGYYCICTACLPLTEVLGSAQLQLQREILLGNQVLDTSCLLGNQLFPLTPHVASCSELQTHFRCIFVNLNTAFNGKVSNVVVELQVGAGHLQSNLKAKDKLL